MMKSKIAVIAMALGGLVFLFFIAAFLLPLQSYGSQWLLLLSTVGILGVGLAIVIGGFSLLLCIPKKTRKTSFQIFIYMVTIVVFSLIGLRFGGMARMNEFEQLAERSNALVKAIKVFVESEKRLPSELAELVPKYLATVPKTGMGAYPDYEFFISEEETEFDGNDWILVVNCSLGVLNWDIFLYYPNGNYPRYGYGGDIVSIKDWAYVHK